MRNPHVKEVAMTRLPTPIRLETRQVIDIRDGAGLTVKVREGAVWITQANDPNDIVLKAGESFVINRPGVTLVSAPVSPAVIGVWPAIQQARVDRAPRTLPPRL